MSNFATTQRRWPPAQQGLYENPSDTPHIFPPPVPRDDIINTTSEQPSPAVIYSGIEPLASLTKQDLYLHFQDTTYPKTAEMLPGSQRRSKIQLVTPTMYRTANTNTW